VEVPDVDPIGETKQRVPTVKDKTPLPSYRRRAASTSHQVKRHAMYASLMLVIDKHRYTHALISEALQLQTSFADSHRDRTNRFLYPIT
jgi:hypothetical protein